jgi:uncharacterized membrane protein
MNLGQVTITPVFPLGLILVIFALGLAATFVQYRVIRAKLGPSRALGLSLLRLGAITFLVAFALNPSLLTTREHKVSPVVGLLIDTSKSMAQPEANGKGSRLDETKALLTNGPNSLLTSLREKFEIKLYGLGESLRTLRAEELSGLKAGGAKGDLKAALKELNGKNTLAVLFSDGKVKWDDSPASELPVLVVPAGNPAEYKDILIKAVRAPSLGFRGREVVIDVTVRGYGYPGLTLPVLLKDGTKLITAKNVRLPIPSPGETTVSLSFTPEEIGRKNLSISIPEQFGESLASNNRLNLSLKVVRDKIRILMVSGTPSMNYRFMRTALKNDPSVDLLSFVILRTPTDILNVPTQEQSLIPFPVETLFAKEIRDFDLLIFDNFNYSLYLSPHHLESIREFVRGGGSFAMIGGPQLVNEGRFGVTPIGEILPVRFPDREEYRRGSPSPVRVSRSGNAHPITRLTVEAMGEGINPISFWREMPSLDGVNLFEPKSSATVLLESADGNAWPILIVSSFGKGRVLTLGTDYSWKWYTGRVAKGKGNLAYLRWVDRMVRWLTKDPSLDPVQVTLPEDNGFAGQEIEVRVRLQEEESSLNLGAPITFSVFNSDGLKIDSKIRSSVLPGEYLASFVPPKGGVHKIRVETSSGQFEESVVVAGALDTLDAAPDHEQLKAIAVSTGGKVVSTRDSLLNEIEAYARKGETRFSEEKRSPLWATPYAMILVLGFFVTEWYYRRRWGLI